jgi:hypothetical protein
VLHIAQLGGLPTPLPDVPVLAVFLFYFGVAAIVSLFLIHRHLQNEQQCVTPVLLLIAVGERLLRVATCAMRIAWAFEVENVRIAVASQILMQSGVLLLYMVNLLLARRILRAAIGDRPWMGFVLPIMSTLTVMSSIVIIASTVVLGLTLDQRAIGACRNAQRAAATYQVILAIMPIVMLASAYIGHRRRIHTSHGLRTALAITAISSLLALFMAGFKAGVIWDPDRSLSNPAWYDSKACLYILELGQEILILTLLVLTNVDKKVDLLNTWKEEHDFDMMDWPYRDMEKHLPRARVSLRRDSKNRDSKYGIECLVTEVHPKD